MIKNNPTTTHSDFLPGPDSCVQDEFSEQQALFDLQPTLVQHFLQVQGQKLAEAIQRKQMQASFMLPDRVHVAKEIEPRPIPAELREQAIGSVIDRLSRTDLRSLLRQRLAVLEGSEDIGVSTAARLLLHSIANTLVHTVLPSGRSVTYKNAEDEDIPTLPVEDSTAVASAITQASDAIVEESASDDHRGELQVPYVPAARRFYLPQWVAFDDRGQLLVNSLNEAEVHLTSMQSFIAILHSAVSLAPYIVADPVYRQKRYGMLGQLINQGRALAFYQTEEMIRIIRQRAAAHDLNRGLSLSLPFFNDQTLELRTHDFEVIPAGRIMFVAAFVVRAAREEEAKVAQDTRLSPSTRKYLLIELKALEKAFDNLSHS